MKIRLLLLSLLLGLTAAPGLHAQAAAPATKPAVKDDDETELGGRMEKMGNAFKKLRRQAGDATKNEDSLAQVAILRASAQEAIKLIPEKAADLPEADRPKFVENFQAKMKILLETIDKLEAALKAGDNAAAQKIVGDLGQQQKEGHGDFRKKKPEKK